MVREKAHATHQEPQRKGSLEAPAGKIGDISIYSKETNYTTWRLAEMNLAIRSMGAQSAHGDTFRADNHPGLKAEGERAA